MNLDETLAEWIHKNGSLIGEIRVTRTDAGFELRHHSDEKTPANALRTICGLAEVRELARYSEADKFRPLKFARSLKKDWRLIVRDIKALRLVLDEFYPACVGLWRSFQSDNLPVVPLQSTLERQTGMYRITQTLDDPGKRKVIERTCATQCLRIRLWDGQQPDSENGHIPLLCAEACNFLVADCRKEAKKKKSSQ